MMRTDKELERYIGKTPEDFENIAEMSSYNHNYYKGMNGDILYADSDDDDYTDWYLVMDDEVKAKKHFGYSLTSEGDKIHINWLME